MSKQLEIHEGKLLNIKQAAALLNVSEISLRRWTDSGRLSCLRVGAKRERRFRRQDLEAFMERQEASTSHKHRRSGARVQSGRILLEGIAIEHGSHLCSLYPSDSGRVKLAVPFLANGLADGDICILIASAQAQREILGPLATVRQELSENIRRGDLILAEGLPPADAPNAMLEFMERSFLKATQTGHRAIRVLGEMTWALDAGMALEDLFRFETLYDQQLARRYPVVSLCQYDVRRFSGSDVLNALRCHPDTFHYPLSRFLG
jgi:transcriptional repressor of dcmA and dcmR